MTQSQHIDSSHVWPRTVFQELLPDKNGLITAGNFKTFLKKTLHLNEAETDALWCSVGSLVSDRQQPGVSLQDFISWAGEEDGSALLETLQNTLFQHGQQPPAASLVMDRLWLGGAKAAQDLEWLRSANVTHVLNVTHEVEVTWAKDHGADQNKVAGANAKNAKSKCKAKAKDAKGENGMKRPKLFRIPISDLIGEDLIQGPRWLEQGLSFLDDAYCKSAGSILINCGMGVSRSCTFAIAFLMRSERVTVSQALKRCQAARPIVGPNAGFMEQLLNLEKSWGLREVDTPPSLELWRYMEQPDRETWEEFYASRREYYPWGVTCANCEEHGPVAEKCTHCGVAFNIK
eukprot:gnl/MRDRNA2_/MRDRNA2_43570_c0_seq2.p1 gnl/MRDRNA2_/MRDRNA2_43570_c0~~gnl/MRDRNA2_/MRDRNA2_43570_c0_seq2.p1  ORF type:complete len:361 (-),score=73.48 gnl/MRDRNA2_/MRDRNA2_43570_c0_seq2:157-1194(-)